MYDLVVRGGVVVDGGGGEPYEADIAISNGLIVKIGAIVEAGAEEIDAKGMIVTPGFVDVHTHYDGQVTWSERLVPTSMHGTTTVVMGNCGVGFAPCHPSQRQQLIELMEGVEDIPGIVLAEGLPWAWETFPEYLSFLEGRRCDVDFATQIPHGPVRVYAMGQRGIDREPADRADMERMAAIVKEAVEAGALGFSTARTLVHRTKGGKLTPTATAAEEELRAIAMGLKEIGKGVLQLTDDFNDTSAENSAEFELWNRLAEMSGRPLSFSLVEIRSDPQRWKHLLNFVERANEKGTTVRVQVSPRPVGIILGLDLSLNPFGACPSYRRIAHLPLADRVAMMREPQMRARLLSEEPENIAHGTSFQTREVGNMYEWVDPMDYMPPPQDKLSARAAAAGASPLELAYDILVSKDGHGMLYNPVTQMATDPVDVTRAMLTHPHSILGLSDGGAHLGSVCDASLSTYLLTYWARDLDVNDRLSLSWAVKALTQDAAAALGLHDRGQIAVGYKGDLNIIDHAKLALGAPYIVRDLPGGGARLTQDAEGYVATVVSGVVTYRNGKATEALPGRLIRGAQPAPANG